MKLRIFAPLLLLAASAFAADPPTLPSIPAEPIAKKKELLFQRYLPSPDVAVCL
jgi:hypothetical protein